MKAMKVFGAITGLVLGIALVFLLSGLIYWGIGAFVVWAFGISFIWTFWHGLALAFITWILCGIFKNK